jgi:formyltetrahydrofolate deformylase
LLPSFPGPQAYRQAYEAGVKVVGVSAHFVTVQLDEGPIIAQGCFSVKPSMRLKDIVEAGQKQEARVLVKAVRLYLARKLDVYWGKAREL